MKKASLLLFLGALAVAACEKQPVKRTAEESELTGTKVQVSAIPTGISKVFILNEGGMGSNNASLDILRLQEGEASGDYITGVFKKVNLDAKAGLGDVGNDIAVNGDELWMVINNSGIVEVVSALDEKEIAVVKVPTPRNIAFDANYAYVSSWAGAYATYSYDATGASTLTDSKNPKGQVYRINLKTKKVEGSVEVGYQPEGLAVSGGKLYVANSGGISCQLAPDYAYDKTVSVIDTKTFKVSKTLEVVVNLKNVYADGKGNVYVTSMGNYYDVHSGLYMIDSNDRVSHISDYVSASAINDGTVYCIGSELEFDWSGAPKTWTAFSCNGGAKSSCDLTMDGTNPYCLCALGDGAFLVGDAGNYYEPGTVSLYTSRGKVWTVTAGVCPGHFAFK